MFSIKLDQRQQCGWIRRAQISYVAPRDRQAQHQQVFHSAFGNGQYNLWDNEFIPHSGRRVPRNDPRCRPVGFAVRNLAFECRAYHRDDSAFESFRTDTVLKGDRVPMHLPQRLQVRGCKRHVLGRAGSSARAHVPHGLLCRKGGFALQDFGIHERAQLLEVAHRNLCCERIVTVDVTEAVAATECCCVVGLQNARQ